MILQVDKELREELRENKVSDRREVEKSLEGRFQHQVEGFACSIWKSESLRLQDEITKDSKV